MVTPLSIFNAPAAGKMCSAKGEVFTFTTSVDTYAEVTTQVVGYFIAQGVTNTVSGHDLLLKVEFTRNGTNWYTLIEDYLLPAGATTVFQADFIAYTTKISVKPAVAGQHGTTILSYLGSSLTIDPSLQSAYDYESLTITNAVAVSVTASKLDSVRQAIITVEDNPIRCRWDGTAPTTTEGHLFQSGDALTLQFATDIYHFRAIATGANAKIRVTYSR
jgi:hypothetical protein